MNPVSEHGAVDPVVEVLRLHKQAMAENEIFHREFAFMSDGTVFTRVSNLEGEGPGWKLVVQVWKDRETLERLAANQQAKGWTAIWHPAYDPILKEFTRFVPVEGLAGPKDPFSL